MKYIDLRRLRDTHLYFAYVYPRKGETQTYLYRLGKLKDFKRKMRDQQRIYDIVKIW